MSAATRVLVVGGGIGGLSATIALRNRGIEVVPRASARQGASV